MISPFCTNNRGYILLPVVMTLTLLALIAFLLNRHNGVALNMVASEAEVDQALAVAEAGLEHAKWLVHDNVCAGDMTLAATALGDHSYTATVDSAVTSVTGYSFNSDRDAFVNELLPDINNGAASPLKVKNTAGDNRRALYHFDLSIIPAQTRVTSATLWLYVVDNDSLGTINLHPVNGDWTENEAIWNNIASSYDDQVLGSITQQLSGDVWVAVNLTALSQSWVNDPTANHGLMLIAALENSLESTYASNDSGSLCPYLEVTTADGEVSPVTLTATATLDSGVTRSLSREAYKAYQPCNTITMQPDAGAGKDAYVSIFRPSANYGVSEVLWVQDWNNDVDEVNYKSLLKFDIGTIPTGARALSAVLSLYQNTPGSNGGLVEVHRITSDWAEGDLSGITGPGVTWDDRDTGLPWDTPGGDYDLTPIAGTQLPVGTKGWFDWDITKLVNGWINGAYDNYGLLLMPAVYGTAVYFDSSDATDPTVYPRLTITYAGECGDAAVAPRGSGKVLMVVSDEWNMTPDEESKKSLFEGWGYTVNLISQWDVDWNFNILAADNDVAYVSDAVDPTTWGLGTRLAEAIIGVVSEEGGLNDDLGISSAEITSVGTDIDIIDISHFITRIFPNGLLPIYSAAMSGKGVGVPLAPDLQILAEWGGNGGLATLDKGAALYGGGTAAGRRVFLPLGNGANLNWTYVTNNAYLILQRALQWGADGRICVDGNFRDAFNTQAYSNNDGTLQWAGDWIEADSAGSGPLTGKVVITGSQLRLNGAPLSATDPSIAREMDLSMHGTATLSFDFQTGPGVEAAEDSVVVEVSDDGGASWTILEDFIDAGPSAMGTRSFDITSYIAVNTQIRFRINAYYSGPNEFFYVDNVDIAADCEPTPVSCDPDYTPDYKVAEFSTSAYGSGNPRGLTYIPAGTTFKTASAPAGGAWISIDTNNGLYMTDMSGTMLESCVVGGDPKDGVTLVDSGTWANHLAISYEGDAQVVFVDLNCNQMGAFSTDSYSDPRDIAYIDSTAGGLYVDHLALIDLNRDEIHIVNQAGTLQHTIDITAISAYSTGIEHLPGTDKFIFTDTIDFKVSTVDLNGTLLGQYDAGAAYGLTGNEGITFNPLTCDHVITDAANDRVVSLNSVGGSPPPTGGNFRDEFNARTFSGSDGSQPWSIDWLEVGESDGPTKGDEVVNDDISDYQLRVRDNDNGGEGVEREADLSGAASATLRFNYRRKDLDSSDDYVKIEVSANGAAGPWTEVGRLAGPDNDDVYQHISYDISAYISSNTRIRFITSPTMGVMDNVWFDNVEINFSQ